MQQQQQPKRDRRIVTGNARQERARKLIVNLIFVIYWLLIFEGALRKWFLPMLAKPLFFIREPFVLLVYVLALKHGMFPRPSPFYFSGIALAVLFLMLLLTQILVCDLNPMVGIYGWRMYFWYLPLAFIIARVFRASDLKRLVRHTLIVAIPIALLTFLQFRSPRGAWINKSIGEDEAFIVAGDVVRAYGTFSFTAGQGLFVGSIVAMTLAIWLMPKSQRVLGRILSVLCSLAVLTNFAVAGNRSVFFYAAVSIFAAIVFALRVRTHRNRFRIIFLLLGVCITGAILYVTLFSHAYELMRARQELAQRAEGSTVMRAVHIVTDVVGFLPKITLLGRGIGVGTIGGSLLGTGYMGLQLAEGELQRIMEETGFLGVIFVLWRWCFVVWLFIEALRACRRTGNPLPLQLWSFAGTVMAVGQISMQGTINGYGWLFAGFSMAANKLIPDKKASSPRSKSKTHSGVTGTLNALDRPVP